MSAAIRIDDAPELEDVAYRTCPDCGERHCDCDRELQDFFDKAERER